MASLAVVGMGAVSPLGDDVAAHAFRVRARLRPAIATAFAADDEPLAAIHVPWLGAAAPIAERAAALAGAALREACPGEDEAPALFLVTPRPRPGFERDVSAALAADLGRPAARFEGEAGAFAALAAADRWIAEQRSSTVAIVAVDSFVDLAALEAAVARPPSPWAKLPLALAEGAFAIAVAARTGGRAAGFVDAAAIAAGVGTDDDDDPVDGAALTELLRRLPPRAPVRALWGQEDVDDLRGRDLRFALARTASLFDPELASDGIERFAGRLGAAAGLGNLVLGLALGHHDDPARAPAGSPLVAWAISPDGTRGVALARGATS